MLVDGPFGVVSAAEFIGIILFVAFVVWAMFAYIIKAETQISKFPLHSKVNRYMKSMIIFYSSQRKVDF